MVILGEDEKGETEGAEAEMNQKQMELSSFSVRVHTQPKTMKLRGKNDTNPNWQMWKPQLHI